jgi:Protein of unknown function VcgC/VcgE (DUF2780)
MTSHGCVGVACVAFLAMSFASSLAARSGPQSGAATQAASKAAEASPELIGALSKEIGATPEQAAGAAGSLFGLAKSRLKANEFAQVSNAVPGMDLLLKAAPTGGNDPGGLASLPKLGGSAAGLASAASAFSNLGLSPDTVGKAVPVLTSFVTKSGGANVGNLLAGVLK